MAVLCLAYASFVTYGDALFRILSAICFPIAWAEDFFPILLELEAGNGTQIAYQKQEVQKAEVISAACERDGPFFDTCVSSTYIAFMGAFQFCFVWILRAGVILRRRNTRCTWQF
jgi:hypothetical protein